MHFIGLFAALQSGLGSRGANHHSRTRLRPPAKAEAEDRALPTATHTTPPASSLFHPLHLVVLRVASPRLASPRIACPSISWLVGWTACHSHNPATSASTSIRPSTWPVRLAGRSFNPPPPSPTLIHPTAQSPKASPHPQPRTTACTSRRFRLLQPCSSRRRSARWWQMRRRRRRRRHRHRRRRRICVSV